MNAPPNQTPPPKSIAIVGGGIAGLAAAYRLTESAPNTNVTLFEAGDRLGGVLQTETRDGYLIEHSADMFVTQPAAAVDLCRRVGLADELIGTDERYRKAFVVRRGRLVPVPSGFALMQPCRIWPVIATPLLSWRGKLRVALEYFLPRGRIHRSRDDARRRQAADPINPHDRSMHVADESVASFARRRLGCEAFDRLVQPLVGGIYTADPEKLSLAATLPRFLEMEWQYRSLIRAAWQERKTHARMKSDASPDDAGGVRYGLFVAPRRGMSSLVTAIADRLSNVTVRLRTPIDHLQRTTDGCWRIANVPATGNVSDFDSVILATPAHVAARLIEPVDSELAGELRAVQYASAAIVCLGYRRSQIAHPLDGFGFVVPAIEDRQILAASFASVKFTGRAPDDRVLIRVFIGGAMQPQLLELDDDDLRTIACRELAVLLGVQGEPELATVARWNNAMPQYHLGHLDRVRSIELLAANWSGLHLVGSAYHGVGIPHCIHSAHQAADRAASLSKNPDA